MFTGPLANVDNFFFVADTYLKNIYQVDATNGVTGQLLPFGVASNPIALAYDSTAKLLYWTDVNDHTINKYSLRTNSTEVIYRDPNDTGKDTGLIYIGLLRQAGCIVTLDISICTIRYIWMSCM